MSLQRNQSIHFFYTIYCVADINHHENVFFVDLFLRKIKTNNRLAACPECTLRFLQTSLVRAKDTN